MGHLVSLLAQADSSGHTGLIIMVVGAILFTIPGVLVAFTHGPTTAFYVLLVYVAVQQLESNIIIPLLQRWAVRLPPALTLLGMNADELAANPQACEWVVHDLNADPVLPFAADTFDHATCCVSVDYLTRPVDVLRDVARVVRAGGLVVCTFSNRLFPTKAIRGWLHSESATHQEIVAAYFRTAGGYDEAETRVCATPRGGDPLYAVWARVA